ncbi:cupin domain-containing protein [Streptomyces sp. Wb2n-11]|uniref:cupin domain-containing protein n=1 Tax=Streptomyces sp. Wb2n-11 TaxID=1030533 RepID=UPI000B16352B
MDELPVAEETHGSAELLFALNGRLELVVDGIVVPVGPGGMYLVPAGARSAVGPGAWAPW